MKDAIITGNSFFAHWIKEINLIKYGTNTNLIPTAAIMEMYQYSDSMLKHLPEKALKKLKTIFFTEETKLSLTTRISIEGLIVEIHLLT